MSVLFGVAPARSVVILWQAPAHLTVGQALLAGLALLLISTVVTILWRRGREADVAAALAIIAAHDERAERWLQQHQAAHTRWYVGAGRHHRPPETFAAAQTITLPRIDDWPPDAPAPTSEPAECVAVV